MNNNLPTPDDLQKSWEDLCNIHAQHLEKHGVKLPKVKRYNEKAKSIWLAVLYYYKGENVHKSFISQICQRDNPNLGPDQQVRHLKRDGWYLTGEQGNHQLDPYKPSLEWETDKKRRDGRLNAKYFDDIKETYENRCATCGTKEGEPSHRYGEDEVKLQRGYIDPDESPTDINNIIPQCQYCNRAYRRDYVFDEKGRVSAIADVRPVRKASEAVQRKVFEWLKKQIRLL